MDVEVGKGAKVMVDGKPGQLTGLPRGTRVLIEKDARGGVVAVRAEGAARLAVVSAVGKGAITVQQRIREGQPAEKVTYPAAGAAVTVEGRPATLTDLKPGDRVTLLLSVDGKRVVALRKGEGRERGRDGDRGARSVRAVIEEIDTKAGTITLGGGERKRALTVAKGVKVTVNGKPGKLEDVKAGGRAVITVTLKEPVEVQAIAVSPPRE